MQKVGKDVFPAQQAIWREGFAEATQNSLNPVWQSSGALVEVRTAQKIAACPAYQLASAVFQP
jgi:hypothetical protein